MEGCCGYNGCLGRKGIFCRCDGGVRWAKRGVWDIIRRDSLDPGVPFQEYVSKMCKWVENLSNAFSVSVSTICEIRTFLLYWVGRTHFWAIMRFELSYTTLHSTYCRNVPLAATMAMHDMALSGAHTITHPKHPFRSPKHPFIYSSYSFAILLILLIYSSYLHCWNTTPGTEDSLQFALLLILLNCAS